MIVGCCLQWSIRLNSRAERVMGIDGVMVAVGTGEVVVGIADGNYADDGMVGGGVAVVVAVVAGIVEGVSACTVLDRTSHTAGVPWVHSPRWIAGMVHGYETCDLPDDGPGASKTLVGASAVAVPYCYSVGPAGGAAACPSDACPLAPRVPIPGTSDSR